MIVAIDRNKFTYLYKYDKIRIDYIQVIDKPVEYLKKMALIDYNILVPLFSKAVPLFEQDHEIILLEIDKNKIILEDGIMISFDSILCIYPMTKMGSQLLNGKISDDFIVEIPVFENVIEVLRINRSMEIRRNTSKKLLALYNLEDIINEELKSAIESATKKNLLDPKTHQDLNTFLDHLIAYNKTPSYLPEGNIEYICKIGAIAIKYLEKQEEVFTKGGFYNSILNYKSTINNKSYLASYLEFIKINNDKLKESYETIVGIISEENRGSSIKYDIKNVDFFKVSYFFLAFKSYINKNDNSIEGIRNQIFDLINHDRNTATFVLTLIGYTFSMENIYEGIHRLSNAPLLKSTHSKVSAEIEKRKRIEAEIQKKNELEKEANEQEKIRLSQLIQKEETKSEVVENVAVIADEVIVEAGIEKAVEEVIHNPIETVSEPIVIYENTEKAEVLESDNSKQQVFEEIISSTESILPNSTEIEKETLTVQIFKSFVSKEYKVAKQKLWLEFIETYFPSKQDEITLEKLMDILNTNPEVKDKLLKDKKDKDSIKSFFG
jgi:hypothetical protein